MSKEAYERFLYFSKIFQRAIKKAQKEHREKGIPNVYCKNGELIWELPDGSFVKESPFKDGKLVYK